MAYKPVPLPDRVQLSPDMSLAKLREFRDYMRRRHSVRDFADTPVSR